MSVLLVLTTAATFAGCSGSDEYFNYRYRGSGDSKLAVITGLTERGRQQKVLVIPKYYNGRKVQVGEGAGTNMAFWRMTQPLRSDNLEKVFFSSSKIEVSSQVKIWDCANLTKIIMIDDEGSTSSWSKSGAANATIYIPEFIYEFRKNQEGSTVYPPANIEYVLNYEEGVFWIDDVDYGDKIEFVPQKPVRESYDFAGWYKETECINKWIFEVDRLPNELFNEGGEVIYQKTKLYAKWQKK
ncbi:MAG: InlB B-repeat-containing protein [Firmicutes bacterium]|nr:InlB B-repeat-containing protein [Bacillota bacterium]